MQKRTEVGAFSSLLHLFLHHRRLKDAILLTCQRELLVLKTQWEKIDHGQFYATDLQRKNLNGHMKKREFLWPMSKLWLFIGMAIIGILYTTLSHLIAIPLFNNIVAHCIILGAMFGLTNFTASILFFKRHDKLKELNRQLSLNLMTDSLTGQLNRRAFDHDIKHGWAEHRGP